MNQVREIIEVHRTTEKKLEDIIHDANRFADSLRQDYKYAKRDIQSLLAEVNVLRAQRVRLSGAVNALTKNREDELVELHEQRELKKHISSSTRNRIGCLFEAAYDRMQADNQDSGELTDEMHCVYGVDLVNPFCSSKHALNKQNIQTICKHTLNALNKQNMQPGGLDPVYCSRTETKEQSST